MTIVLSTAVDIGFKAAYNVRGGCSVACISEDATLARLRWGEVARWGGKMKCPGLKTCARKEQKGTEETGDRSVRTKGNRENYE